MPWAWQLQLIIGKACPFISAAEQRAQPGWPIDRAFQECGSSAFSKVDVLVCFCCDKHNDKKQLGEERVHLAYRLEFT